MKLLLKHGADAKLTDWNGNSVLSCLLYFDEMDIDEDTVSAANLLLENGADPNQYNAANEGPVRMLLCRWQSLISRVLRSFVQHGVRLDDSEQNIGKDKKQRVSTKRMYRFVRSSCAKPCSSCSRLAQDGSSMAAGCESDRNMRDWLDTTNSTMTKLMRTSKDIRLCLAIVLDGFRVSDEDLASFQETDLDDDDDDAESSSKKMFCDFRSWLTEDRKQAPSLMRQCRTAIRRQLLLRTGHRSILSFPSTFFRCRIS
jgi:hypothetical protein